MIAEITPDHHAEILKNNARFVHWLSPLNEAELITLLDLASYTRQIDKGKGALIGYSHDVDYDHKNLAWLRSRFDAFFYIDRIIIAEGAQRKGYGHLLYADFETQARIRGLPRLVCEVNTRPDNPGSHQFHKQMGFTALADIDYSEYGVSLRYYEKSLIG